MHDYACIYQQKSWCSKCSPRQNTRSEILNIQQGLVNVPFGVVFFTSPSSIWRWIRSVGGGSCCFALPQLVEGPTREQPNTPRATLFAGRLASSCRHWFWLLEFDMDVIWCYMMLCWFCSYFLLESPWYSPKSTWYTSTGECPTAVETAWTWNDHQQSLWRQGICWPKAAKITLNSSIHHCIGMHQTIHAQAICQPCCDFGRQNHMLKSQTTYGKNGRKSWCSCSCGSLGSGGWSLS